MGETILYASVKEAITTSGEIPPKVRKLIEFEIKSESECCYIDCKETLKNLVDEKDLEEVAKWFEDNNLYEKDLTLEI